MYLNTTWWIALIVYFVIFCLVALVFQWIDFGKIMKKEGQKYTVFVYFLATLTVTFCIGTMILIITSLPMTMGG